MSARTATYGAASMAADALAAAELVRRASPFAQAILLAELAARHPDQARELLDAAEDAQEAITGVWAANGIAKPSAGMFPAVAVTGTPDAVTEAREVLELARADLSAAMDRPTPEAELQDLRERLESAEDAWCVNLAVRGGFGEW